MISDPVDSCVGSIELIGWPGPRNRPQPSRLLEISPLFFAFQSNARDGARSSGTTGQDIGGGRMTGARRRAACAAGTARPRRRRGGGGRVCGNAGHGGERVDRPRLLNSPTVSAPASPSSRINMLREDSDLRLGPPTRTSDSDLRLGPLGELADGQNACRCCYCWMI